MNLCALCGLSLSIAEGLCSHHGVSNGEDWSAGNRIWCAFFHRGEVPRRLTPWERDDNFWTSDVPAGQTAEEAVAWA